jgi:hypothetical protein
MKIFILFVTLNVTLSGIGQEAFVLGKTYPVSYVVFYPTIATMYISKGGPFVAKKYPNADANNWTAYTPPVVAKTSPVVIPVVIPTYARQSAFDSLLSDLKASKAKQDAAEAKAGILETSINLILSNLKGFQKYFGAVDSLVSDVKELKQEPDANTLSVSRSGFPLIMKISDTAYKIASIILAPGSGLVGKLVNGDLVIDKK